MRCAGCKDLTLSFHGSRNKRQPPAREMGSDCQGVVSMKIPDVRAVR